MRFNFRRYSLQVFAGHAGVWDMYTHEMKRKIRTQVKPDLSVS